MDWLYMGEPTNKTYAVISKNYEDFRYTMSHLFPLGRIISGGNKFEYGCNIYYCISMIDHGRGRKFDSCFCTEQSQKNRNHDDILNTIRWSVDFNYFEFWGVSKNRWESLYSWSYCNYKMYGI